MRGFNLLKDMGNFVEGEIKKLGEKESWQVCHYCQFELPNCIKDGYGYWICEECLAKCREDLIDAEIEEISLNENEKNPNTISN